MANFNLHLYLRTPYVVLIYFSIITQISLYCPFVAEPFPYPPLLVTADMFALPVVLTLGEKDKSSALVGSSGWPKK